jgi:hypothetical protein
MPKPWSFLILLVLGFFVLFSCAHLHDSTEQETPQPEEPAVTEEPEEAVEVDLPVWHEPGRAYKLTGDSLVVTAAAVAADSSDALAIAELALKESITSGITKVILQLLDDAGKEVQSNVDAAGAAIGERQDLIRLMTMDEEIIQEIHPNSQKIHWHRENGQVRCYLRYSYDRVALIEAFGSI